MPRRPHRRVPIPGLILAGDSPRAAATRALMARQRDRYGPKGFSPETLQRIADATRRRPHPRATHCLRGHKYTLANTYRGPDRKQRCRACRQVEQHRRRWTAHQAKKLAALKTAMLRAHPDVGGSHIGFIVARRRYLAALARSSGLDR
jgi:hypothetical protein